MCAVLLPSVPPRAGSASAHRPGTGPGSCPTRMSQLFGWLIRARVGPRYCPHTPSPECPPGRTRAPYDNELGALVPAAGWQRLSCADGSKGPRLYDWALIATARAGHWLLARRSLHPGEKGELELAFFRCWSPRPVALPELMLAHAFLAVTASAMRPAAPLARACGSGIHWSAPRPTCRHPRWIGRRCTARWGMSPTRGLIRTAGPGTVPRPRPGRTRTSPPSWSARPAGRRGAAGWPRRPRSWSARRC